MPEEQIRCRAASPVAVLTVGLMRAGVNYGIVHVALSCGVMDCELHYHAREGFAGETRESG